MIVELCKYKSQKDGTIKLRIPGIYNVPNKQLQDPWSKTQSKIIDPDPISKIQEPRSRSTIQDPGELDSCSSYCQGQMDCDVLSEING